MKSENVPHCRRATTSSSSSTASLTAPPDGTPTEQYHPPPRSRAAVVETHTGDTSALGTAEPTDGYHARLRSYTSDLEGQEMGDTLTAPAPTQTTHMTTMALPERQPPSSNAALAAPRAGILSSSGYRSVNQVARTLPPPPSPPPPPPPPPQQRQTPQRNYQSSSCLAADESGGGIAAPSPSNFLHRASPENDSASPRSSSSSPSRCAYKASPPTSIPLGQLSSPPRGSVDSRSEKVVQRGAVFEYASEAVNTLEQQYGDALQRLGVMHRLYNRLDQHNRSLQAEAQRVRRISDTLHKGVAFDIYNRVRQVKHETRLLKQYTLLLCAGFGDQLRALQQVVAEELPLRLGHHTGYTALLPHGAEGRLRQRETRVSVGMSSSGGAVGWPSPSTLARPSATAAGTGTSNMLLNYRPDNWLTAVSTFPPRLLEATPEDEDDVFEEDRDAAASHPGSVASPGWPSLNFGEIDNDASDHAQLSHGAAVPPSELRAVQMALAAAQRRVVELEQATSNQEVFYESRIAQLKAAHRAKEATLKEELTILRRTASPVCGPTLTEQLSTSLDLQQLALALQNIPEKQHSSAPQQTTGTSPTLPSNSRSPPSRQEESSRAGIAFSEGEMKGRSGGQGDPGALATSLQPTEESDEEDENFDGEAPAMRRGDSSSSSSEGSRGYRRSSGPVENAATGRKGAGRRVGKGKMEAQRPGRSFTPLAAAQRAERTREVHDHNCWERKKGSRSTALAGRATPNATPSPRSLAYDRLVNPSHRASGTAFHRTRAFNTHTVAPDHPPAELKHGTTVGRAQRDAPVKKRQCIDGAEGIDPQLVRSLCYRLAAMSGDSRLAYTADAGPHHARPSPLTQDTALDRVAQGMWAQELLKERNCL